MTGAENHGIQHAAARSYCRRQRKADVGIASRRSGFFDQTVRLLSRMRPLRGQYRPEFPRALGMGPLTLSLSAIACAVGRAAPLRGIDQTNTFYEIRFHIDGGGDRL